MGACVGSFLNVVIWRLPNRGLEVSYLNKKGADDAVVASLALPRCAMRPIHWYQNMPVLSYLFLRGKCGNCRAAIPIRCILWSNWGRHFYGWGFTWRITSPRCRNMAYPWQGARRRDHGFPHGLKRRWCFMPSLLRRLLAASAIDADLFIIPLSVTVMLAILGLVCCVIIGPPFFNSFAIIPSLSPGTLWLGKPILGATFGADPLERSFDVENSPP